MGTLTGCCFLSSDRLSDETSLGVLAKELMPHSINVRQCTHADAEAVTSLLPQLWPDQSLDRQLLKDTFHKAIDSPQQRYLCAIVESQIVGFCSLSIKHSLWCQSLLAHIDEIIVDSNFRGRGIGTRLLEEAEKIAVNLRSERVELDSAFHRRDAHRFYEKMGFENRAYLFSKKLADIDSFGRG